MRKDMSKVIVERPRPGSRSRTEGTFRQKLKHAAQEAMLGKDLDEVNDLSNFLGMRKLHKETRSFNEYLQPLRRFILSRVGQPWDNVYSEICEHLNRDSTVHDHIFQHLFSYVERDTFLGDDGEVYVNSRWGLGKVNVNEYYCDTYVHPTSGILCKPIDHRANQRVKRRAERELELRRKYRVVNDSLMFERNEDTGAWFALVIEPAEKAWEREKDLWGNRTSKHWFIHSCVQKYGAAVHVVPGFQRSASKKDIKKYGLNLP